MYSFAEMDEFLVHEGNCARVRTFGKNETFSGGVPLRGAVLDELAVDFKAMWSFGWMAFR
jgi:hypothetical protein